jgi:hypothetical protein
MAKRRAGAKNKVPLEILYGDDIASDSLVLSGMRNLERELNEQFKQERVTAAETERLTSQIYRSVFQVADKDGQAKAAQNELKKLGARWAKLPLKRPKRQKAKQRVFPGSIAATLAPPFNYQWTWSATSRNPSMELSADRNTGDMSFYIWTKGSTCSGSARAANGIFFRPVTENGILRLWANPAFDYAWLTSGIFRTGHSDAFIGLYVGRYNLSGGFAGAVVNQTVTLWDDSPTLGSSGLRTGSNSGYPLFAQFDVDRSHWYALWVWCGGRAKGDAGDLISGSMALSRLNVNVPSITWELF